MFALLIMLGLWVGGVVVAAGTLALVARWLRYRRTGFAWALLVASVWMGMAVGSFVSSMSMRLMPKGVALGADIAALTAIVAIEIMSIRNILGTSTGRAFAGWANTLLVRIALSVVAILMVRGRLVEAYGTQTIAMAPTLFPQHYVGVCPRCGGTLIYIAEAARLPGPVFGPPTVSGFCMKCRQETVTPVAVMKAPQASADYFLVNDLLAPRRWDMIAYRHGADVFIKRVIGMPGEEVCIDGEGRVLINGKDAGSPPDAPELRFGWPTEAGITSLLKVKADEKEMVGEHQYFVIGDFAERSVDSRYDGPAAASDIVGVVSFVYWPPARMRIVR